MSRIDDDEPLDAGTDEGGDEELLGEGNRTADRRYREATQRFVAEGKVAEAADEARRAVDDEDEREELERAERAGRARAKEHDPELRKS
jgi:hypothetical protein